MLREVGTGMCAPDEKSDVKHGFFAKVLTYFGNLRNSGLPPHRILFLAIANLFRRVHPVSGCCGSYGHPGC